MLKYKNEIDLNCKNVSIFADFDNIYYSLSDYGLNLNLDDYNIFYWMNMLYGTSKIRSMAAFANFEQLNITLRALQNQRVNIHNVFGNNRKNSSDIELSLCALQTFYEQPNIDTFVFITSDSDMIPIMNKLLYFGKKVHLYSIEENSNPSINNFCNLSVDILELMNLKHLRKEPEKFFPEAMDIISKFFNFNPDKIFYHKRLQDNLVQSLYLSPYMANRVIELLVNKNILKKVELENSYGYKNTKR